jgi:hypothetical protein
MGYHTFIITHVLKHGPMGFISPADSCSIRYRQATGPIATIFYEQICPKGPANTRLGSWLLRWFTACSSGNIVVHGNHLNSVGRT